jgi:LmbE family N-acetylglucosaminyl deacetylase
MNEIPSSAMVIVAHPDDAEFGCAGTVARWTKGGATVVYVICTNGNKGTSDPDMIPERLAEIRQTEQTEACRVLGVKDIVFLRHPDGELEDTREFRGELVREIRRYAPEVVICQDTYRQSGANHRDHRICGRVTLDAVYPYARDRLHFPELYNQGFLPHKVGTVLLSGPDEPDVFVDISDTLEIKLQALMCHTSQFGDAAQEIQNRMREGAQVTGGKGGVPYAEAYRKIELRR